MIAAIYARKSTEQFGVADEQKSVARQIDQARRYAESKGWTVVDDLIFVDDGISGAEFANRPGFVRLMTALKPRPIFNVLVMSEESRLGREMTQTMGALGEIVRAGVRVFYYMDDKEATLNSPIEKAMVMIGSFSGELEREKARQRTYDAMSRKARSGHVTGGLVFGYKNVDVLTGKVDGSGRPIRSHVERRINDAEAVVVREIFERCAKGQGKVAIAKALNATAALTPRGRSKHAIRAWAGSSVREILYRPLYRGQIVWNKTRKRNQWGQVKPSDRQSSEWMTVDAPQLRIVSEELWQAAHDRLEATRSTYLRSTRGTLWGRPPSGLASKYLLVGMARCGVCGAGLEVRSRKGKERSFYYSCSSYYRRGSAICPNRYEIPMSAADSIVIEALLDELLTPVRLTEAIGRVLDRARQAQESPDEAREQLERQLADVEGAQERLTAAIATGGDVPALVQALKTQETQRLTLTRRLEALSRPAPTFDAALEEKLTRAVYEWREVLGRQVVQARQIVTKLLADKLTFTPESRDGLDGFRFDATGTVTKLISGVVPGHVSLQAVASPPGIEPGSRP